MQRFRFEDRDVASGFGRTQPLLPTMAVIRLGQLKQDKPLFPALCQIEFESGRCIEEYVLLLLEPTVVSMTVNNYHTDRRITASLLCMLPTLQIKLSELVLDGDSWLVPDALAAIGKLTSLRTLRLSIPAKNTPFAAIHGLRELDTIHIAAGEAFILHFLANIPSRKLVNVTLLRKDRQPWWIDSGETQAQDQAPSFWHHIAEILQDKAKHTLRSLSIQDLVLPDPFTSFKFQSFADLLYPVRGLEHLEVGSVSQAAVVITDEDYEKMAAAWPHIKTLHLLLPYITPIPNPFGNSSCSHRGTNHPTAKALTTLAQHCHHLESLQLYLPSVDFTQANVVLPTNFWGNPSLRKLWLGSCSVPDPMTISMHLSSLFPNLRSVAGVTPFPGSSNAVAHPGSACGFEWMTVQKHLAVIHDIRAAERMRVASILHEERVPLTVRARKLIHV